MPLVLLDGLWPDDNLAPGHALADIVVRLAVQEEAYPPTRKAPKDWPALPVKVRSIVPGGSALFPLW